MGGGCRGRVLARELREQGHALRITTRSEQGRAAIEATGSECWVGTPERLATLRGVLDGVAIACWMLARAEGSEQQLLDLHRERLEFFLTQLIDTTVRGFVYERGDDQQLAEARAADRAQGAGTGDGAGAGAGATPAAVLAAGEQTARRLTERNAIPLALLRADASDRPAWLRAAHGAIERLLARA